jgi:hypothetical protein
MEHRCGLRVATDVEVRLFGYPASIGRGRVRDISVSGGFIETQLSLAPPAIVRVTLPVNDCWAEQARAIQAIVVRRTHEGLGVEWIDAVPEILASLFGKVSESRPAGQIRSRTHAGPPRPLHYE